MVRMNTVRSHDEEYFMQLDQRISKDADIDLRGNHAFDLISTATKVPPSWFPVAQYLFAKLPLTPRNAWLEAGKTRTTDIGQTETRNQITLPQVSLVFRKYDRWILSTIRRSSLHVVA